MAMTHIYYYCEKCKKVYKAKCTCFGELPQKCAKCGCENIKFRDIVRDGKPEPKLILGHGGSGSTKFGK